LVVTADAWTNEVLAPFGVRLPLRLLQEQVAYFDASRPELFDMKAFPVWIWHSHPHAYGLPSYGLAGPKVALHGGGPEMGPAERTFEPDADYAAKVDAFVDEHLPAAAGPKLEIKTCQYALTPDADFVLDQIPGAANTAVGLGTGHAFKFASAFGRALVDLAVDGDSEYRFPRFAINRFDKN
jgi:sarcosine oxidase